MKPLIAILTLIFISSIYVNAQDQNVCYNNGSPNNPDSPDLGFITHLNQGCNSADVSVLQSDALRFRNFGYSNRLIRNTTLAEDFVLAKEEHLTSVDFYAFNDEPGLEPLVQQVSIRIWSGQPGETNSTVIYGDLLENSLIFSEFTGSYRTNERTIPSCIRPIMKITASLDVTLGPGTYWIEWQFQVPEFVNHYRTVPITILGVAETGNSIQSEDGGLTFEPVVDQGNDAAQGLPFVISCSVNNTVVGSPIPTMGQWALICLTICLMIISTLALKPQSDKSHEVISRY